EPAAEPEAAAAAPDEPPVAQFDPEIAAIFTEEAAEILDSAEQALQSIREGGDHGAIVELQRFLHTLKGGARMAGVAAMGDLSHALETLLADMASGRVAPDDAAVDLVQLTLDELHRMRDTIDARRAVADAADLRRRVESFHRGVEADGAVAEPAAPPPAAEPLPPSAPELEVEVAADDRRPDDAVAPLELLEPAGDAEPAGAPAPAETVPEEIAEQMLAAQPEPEPEPTIAEAFELADAGLSERGAIELSPAALQRSSLDAESLEAAAAAALEEPTITEDALGVERESEEPTIVQDGDGEVQRAAPPAAPPAEPPLE